MKKYPNEWRLSHLLASVDQCAAHINGKWVPARALGLASFVNRIRLAWLVFTGRADALIWPEGQ